MKLRINFQFYIKLEHLIPINYQLINVIPSILQVVE